MDADVIRDEQMTMMRWWNHERRGSDEAERRDAKLREDYLKARKAAWQELNYHLWEFNE